MALGQPLWSRLAFAVLAGALLLVLALSPRAPVYQGAATVLTEFQGTVEPGASALHPLRLVVPASASEDGLALAAAPVELGLRPLGLRGAPYLVAVLDANGVALLNATLDPTNPLSAPAGPPTVRLPTGQYQLRVAPVPGTTNATPYRLEVTASFPYSAAVEGTALNPLALLLPALAAAAWSLTPLPRGLRERLAALRRRPR